MKRICWLLLPCIALVSVSAVQVREAFAIKPFKEVFDKKYVKSPPGSDAEKKLAEAVETAKCNVCHVGENKKMRNAYGEALKKFLTKKDGKDTDKIIKALDDVAKQHSDPNDDKSPTYGELIAEGKLPAGG